MMMIDTSELGKLISKCSSSDSVIMIFFIIIIVNNELYMHSCTVFIDTTLVFIFWFSEGGITFKTVLLSIKGVGLVSILVGTATHPVKKRTV